VHIAYEVDELRRTSTVVPVEPRTVDVLAYLLKNSDPGSSAGTSSSNPSRAADCG